MLQRVDYMRALEAAIWIRHKCRPTHKETVFVREATEADETIWEGHVETFDLSDHKEAKRCYAWQHTNDKGVKIFAVLENHVVNSANRAVQAAIFADAQPPIHAPRNDTELLKELDSSRSLFRGTVVEEIEGPGILSGGVRESRDRKQQPDGNGG